MWPSHTAAWDDGCNDKSGRLRPCAGTEELDRGHASTEELGRGHARVAAAGGRRRQGQEGGERGGRLGFIS
jgi:hypothetical protein